MSKPQAGARAFGLRFLCLSAALLLSAAPVVAQPPAGYYDSVDTTNATTLRQTLHHVIDDHTRFPYTASTTDTWDILNMADEDPNNSGNILDVYRNASYPKITGGIGDYNREHTWPKSFGFPDDGDDNYPYTDCHHLFLSDAGYNGARSNKPYRYCTAACTEHTTLSNNGSGGGSGAYPGNSNWTSGEFSAGTWETWIGRRGDVARAMFYMDVRYEGGVHEVSGFVEPDLELTDDDQLIEAFRTGQNESLAYMGILSVLLQWHAEDPVDALEIWRNEVVYTFQGNRNPFIDNPQWVDCLYQDVCSSDMDPPAAPQSLMATAQNGSVGLSWLAGGEPDLAGYNVLRATASGGPYSQVNAGTVGGNVYTDSTVTNGVTYYYVVTAVDTSGNESPASNEASATPSGSLPDTTPPAAPTGFSATAGDGQVGLSWNANTEPDLDGYNLYRSTTSGFGFALVNGALLTTTSFTDTGLANGTTYYYLLAAVDTSGNESADSSEVSATPAALGSGGILLSEVLYDVSSTDDGWEWVELYNAGSAAVDLSGYSLGNGGTDYTYSTVQLSGIVAPGQTFVVGGPSSGGTNSSPVIDLAVNFSPDFQNSGSAADGVALFDVPASQINASTVPVDAVRYGSSNSNGLIDETGAASAPEVGDASSGSSIERVDLAGSWQIQSSPTPNSTPLAPVGNTAPSATILSPATGSSFDEGTSATFSGSASDAEDGDLSASLSWSSNLDGSLGNGSSVSTSTLSVGTHTITASVTDSGGLTDSDAITVTIAAVAVNTAPTVTIQSPASGSSFDEGTSVSFSGSASDAEDGDLSASLSWSSNLDGSLGNGSSVSMSTLSVGTHTITASVTDSGGLSDSDAITVTIQASSNPVTVTFISIGAEDGWVRESNETSGVGGSSNSGGAGSRPIRAGDANNDRQYKAILSFDTSSIPDGAIIQSATLRLRRGRLTGSNPFTSGFGQCLVDVQTGGFGGSTALAASDFQAPATAVAAASLGNAPSNGDWSEGGLNASGLAALDKAGTTQLRVYFQVDDNDDGGNDYMGYYSGDHSNAANRPQLVVTYQ